MSVLLTGASGMVGKNLVNYFEGKGVRIVATDLVGRDASGDLLDKDFVFNKLAFLDFDSIIHLAGITDIKKTIDDPRLCFDVNCVGTLNVLELARLKRVKRIICACYDTSTRVFTTNGLKRCTELNIGDGVFTLNKANWKIEVHPIQRIHIYPYEGKLIHFDGKRVDLLVTPNHSMLIRALSKRDNRPIWRPLTEEASRVSQRAVCKLQTGTWEGSDLGVDPKKYGVGSLKDLFYLVGLFVGDGNLNGEQCQTVTTGLSKTELIKLRDSSGHFTTHPSRPIKKEYFYPRIFLSIPATDKSRQKIECLLQNHSIKWSGYQSTVYLYSEPLYRLFEQCYDKKAKKKSPHAKRIPRWMLGERPENLAALLEGLLDSDGSRGRILTTVSHGLAEDTMELCAKLSLFTVCSLGHSVSFLDERRIESTSVRISISSRKGAPMFGRSYGNVHEEDYSGNVFCLEVENHNFLVERNGKIAFSGNSSANVFGAPKTNPVTEDAPFDPRVPYDYSKVIIENLAMSYFKTKGVPACITRSWLLFGEFDQPTRATIRFIRACLKGEPLTLFNGGKDTTSPSHAANYAKLALQILDNDRAIGQAFNFGGERPISVRELAETVRRLTDSKSELQLAPPRSELEKEPQISYPSIEKAESLLGYRHELNLEQGLQRTIEWVKRQA